MNKKTAAVLFGGQSPEYEVSCLSMANVIHNIDCGAYDFVLVGIVKGGYWVKMNRVEGVEDDSWRGSKIGAVFSPDTTKQYLMIHEQAVVTRMKIDLVFPVPYGLYDEDGTIQGPCRLMRIPFAGCGAMASVVGMDKDVAKLVVYPLGIRQTDSLLATNRELKDMCTVIDRTEDRFPYPVSVKPCNTGSSRGVTEVHKGEELAEALCEVARSDSRILIEECIMRCEIERAVFGSDTCPVQASGTGEVLAVADFYDYDAKYYNAESETVVDPGFPGGSAEEVYQSAIRTFDAFDDHSLSRVDFLVTVAGEVIFNEINTIPGFTVTSIYPTLSAARGRDKKTLVKESMEPAFERGA